MDTLILTRVGGIGSCWSSYLGEPFDSARLRSPYPTVI